MYEDVLLLRLHQVVPLPPHVLQQAENVEPAGRGDLTADGVDGDVGA